jgi:sugar lactone lactonase YvrE
MLGSGIQRYSDLLPTSTKKIKEILNPACKLGEGLFVKDSVVFWLDIDSRKLYFYKHSKVHCYDLPVQASVIFDLQNKNLILGSMLEIGSFNISTGNYKKISSFPKKISSDKNFIQFRTNDGCMIDDETFIFGTMKKYNANTHKGHIYIASLNNFLVIDRLHIPNTFIQLPDGDILISDSYKKTIWKYKFIKKNFVSKNIFKKFKKEIPDGGCLIDNQFLCIAMYNSSAVYILSLAGDFLKKIKVPMLHPTNCKYDKSSKKLWITSAQSAADKSEMSGKTISVKI